MKYFLAGLLALLPEALFSDELLIFHMPGCLPCAKFEQILEENPELTQGFAVSRIDITTMPDTAAIFNVSSVPTVVRLDDKTKEIARNVGLMSKREFKEWLIKHNN
jgi:thioredoxin-like negative regulator of GroEL